MYFLSVHMEGNPFTKIGNLSQEKELRLIQALLFNDKDKVVPKQARKA
jgi:hypothetical protein